MAWLSCAALLGLLAGGARAAPTAWLHRDQTNPLGAASSYLRALRTQTGWNVREQANLLLNTAAMLEPGLRRSQEMDVLPRYHREARALLQSADDSLKSTAALRDGGCTGTKSKTLRARFRSFR